MNESNAELERLPVLRCELCFPTHVENIALICHPQRETGERHRRGAKKEERTESPEAAALALAEEEKGAIRGLALLPPPAPPRVLLRTSAALEVRARRSIIEGE